MVIYKNGLLPLLLILLASMFLFACDSNDSDHEHVFELDWSYNEFGHFKDCECHPDQVVLYSHEDKNSDGLCDECGFEITPHKHVISEEWSKNETHHYKDCECHPEVIEYILHEDKNSDGLCDECLYVIEEVKEYEILVVDSSKNPIQNAEVKITNGEMHATTKTNEEGKISFNLVYVTEVIAEVISVPSEYELIEGVQTVLEPSKTITIVAADLLVTYTINTQRETGESLKNVVVSLVLRDEYGTENVVASKTTDESGTVSFEVKEDSYILKCKHINSAYSLVEESEVVLDKENNAYLAVFSESTDNTEYVFNFYDTSGNIITEGNLYSFTEFGCSEGLLAINSRGMAIANQKNANYIYQYVSETGQSVIFETFKDEATTIDIIVDSQTAVGSSEENPVLLFLLLDLPYVYEEIFTFNWNYSFEAGESLYVKVPNALGTNFSIDGTKFSILYNDEELTPNAENRIDKTFDDLEVGEDAIFKVTAKEIAVEDFKYYNMSDPNKYEYIGVIREEKSGSNNYYYQGQTSYGYILVNKNDAKEFTVEVTNLTYELIFEREDDTHIVYTIKFTALKAGEGTYKIIPIEE